MLLVRVTHCYFGWTLLNTIRSVSTTGVGVFGLCKSFNRAGERDVTRWVYAFKVSPIISFSRISFLQQPELAYTYVSGTNNELVIPLLFALRVINFPFFSVGECPAAAIQRRIFWVSARTRM